MVDGETKSHAATAHDRYCGFGDFQIMLSALASKIFSSAKWNARFPKMVQKARLLLFWMDQQSVLFPGNGAALMNKVVENQIQDAENEAEMEFDTEGCDELGEKFPAMWKAVEGEGESERKRREGEKEEKKRRQDHFRLSICVFTRLHTHTPPQRHTHTSTQTRL